MSFIAPLQNVIVQKGYLERKFQDALLPVLGFDKLCEVEPLDARVGEGKTMTRRAILPPITQDVVPTATVFTDLNNGITPQVVTYEQYNVTMAKRRGMMTLDLELNEYTIANEYIKNWEDLGRQAGQSQDLKAAQTLYTAYDSGNTFATANGTVASGTMTVHVDNINGFDTAYSQAIAAGQSPGVPQPVTASNPLAANVIAASNGATISVLVVAAAPDGTNTSTGNVAGAAYGRSGNLSIVLPTGSSATLAMALGDTLNAVDGAVVLRPNGKLNRNALISTDLATLSQLTRAKAKLKMRGVQTLPNGMYACMIDSLLWSDLENDPNFRAATQGSWGQVNSFFANGATSKALGLEFVETNVNPVFAIPGQPYLVERHALVVGMGCVVKAPSVAFERAARQANAEDVDGVDIVKAGATNVRFVNGIKLVTRQPLDPEASVVTQTWSLQQGNVAATDITSTPAQIAGTDTARFKRGIMVSFASAA